MYPRLSRQIRLVIRYACRRVFVYPFLPRLSFPVGLMRMTFFGGRFYWSLPGDAPWQRNSLQRGLRGHRFNRRLLLTAHRWAERAAGVNRIRGVESDRDGLACRFPLWSDHQLHKRAHFEESKLILYTVNKNTTAQVLKHLHEIFLIIWRYMLKCLKWVL